MMTYEEFEKLLKTVKVTNVTFGIGDNRRFARFVVTVTHQIPPAVLEEEEVSVFIDVEGYKCTSYALLSEEGNTFLLATGLWLKDEEVSGKNFRLRIRAFGKPKPEHVIKRGTLPPAGVAWDKILGNG